MKLPKLTKNQKIGTGVGVLAVIGTALGIHKYKARKNKRENEFLHNADIMNIQVSPGGNSNVASFPLKFGKRGDKVKRLQIWLNSQAENLAKKYMGAKVPTLKVDGIFGKHTLQAVRLAFKSDEVTKASFNKYKM